MIKPGIRFKLFIAFCAVIVTTVLVTGFVLSRILETSLMSRIELELQRQAALGIIAVTQIPEPLTYGIADPLADRVSRAVSARVTIVREDGTVMGDSELSLDAVRKVENHAKRFEIQAALAHGRGTAIRFSHTVMRDMLYVALPFTRREGRGVVRVSKTFAEVTQIVSDVRNLLLISCVVGIIVSVLMSSVSTHFLSGRLRMLVRFSEQLVTGHRGSTSPYAGGVLGWRKGSVNEMSRRLEAHVTALAIERDQFEAVLDGMNEAVVALDQQGNVTLINRAGAMLLGISGSPSGRMLLDTVRLPALHRIAKEVTSARDEVAEFDLPGEPRRTILAKATRLRNDGVVIVLGDVSELRRLERVRRDFVSNVSHELRTPVAIIQANAETLSDGGIDDREAAARFLASMVSNAKRLSNLIADLLDISKIEEGQYALNLAPLPVAPSLWRAAAALETQATERGLSIQVAHGIHFRVDADVRALDQILFNFLDNAVKYSNPGGRIVMRVKEEGDAVRIEVEDNGPGVAPQFRERLFERFFRVDEGRSRAMGGTGLGLAIVKHLALAMNGEVGMSPASPNGSRFWVSLPSSRA